MKLRIAPSPTGQLHIGNARTALFNGYTQKQIMVLFLYELMTQTQREVLANIKKI